MNTSAYETIEIRYEQDICIISINRPDKLNALNTQVLREIGLAVGEAAAIAIGIIITGSGTRAFAAGADIAEFAAYSAPEGQQMSAAGQQVMDRIENCPVPVVAAIHGFALGGGCELAMACHFRVSSHSAQFGQPEVKLGLIPGFGGTQRLPRLIGRTKGLEMLLTGDPINAEEARALGLLNAVVDEDQVMSTCENLLRKIASRSPNAVAKTIQLVNDLYTDGVDGMKRERELFGECFNSQEFKEGTDAFLNKRKADFRK